MKRRIRWLAAALCLCVAGCALGGCKKDAPDDAREPISLYASFYPLYALSALIVQDVPDLGLFCLVQPQDGCLRNYELSDWDLSLISRSADALIIGGRGLESFEGGLYALGEDGPAVASVLYNVALERFDAINAADAEDTHWADDNPHIYLRVDGALAICERIAANLQTLDPRYSALYAHNLSAAEQKLEALRGEIQQYAGDLSGRGAIVMNEALAYAAREYGLEIELCYARESGEALTGSALEACLSALADCDAKLVLIEKQAPQRLCAALEAAGYAVAKLDTLSTHRADEGTQGYFEALRANARAVREAIEGKAEKAE